MRQNMKNKQMSTEDWQEYRADQKKRRVKRLPIRVDQVYQLRNEGYLVKRLSEYQFRITKESSNIKLDIYPIHLCFHVIKTGNRGKIRNPKALKKFVDSVFSDKKTTDGICYCHNDTLLGDPENIRIVEFTKAESYYFEQDGTKNFKVFQDNQKTRPVKLSEQEFNKYFKIIRKGN